MSAHTLYETRSYAQELAGNPHLDDLLLTLRLADAADAVTTARFGALDLHVETKPDNTPVSDADRATERAIRDILAEERPDDAIYGEELGRAESTGRRWIIDPIDGTKNYVRGVPVWATLIGLQEGDDLVVGVVSAPWLHTRWFALKDGGAYMGRGPEEATRIHVSHVAKVEDASMSMSSLTGWRDRGDRDELIALTDSMWRLRGFGDFWSYMLVAQGAVDAAAEPELDLYDMAALVPIVTEAGGRFTDLDGNPGPWGGCALASNGLLHEAILKAL
ncbi:histidinol-phosphatase [Bifidobacterium sp. DSM 109958]|uniref:Histidinol-phosphatase n=1 Tax=Bifidobacterium moraviense TaxID=2675323 RepID=A0A7Y0HWT7_9BIFI|nr:histidinol-phosphatase [Bifidobacterium sp. DSM 109958]NMM99585.1 histidinol-phosphatase [Bifidobacterium sp. DSM 109958]